MSKLLQICEPGQTPLPHEEEDNIAIGIDLGTTNSLVAFANDGRPLIIGDLIPSIVTNDKSDQIRSFKKFMGKGSSNITEDDANLFNIDMNMSNDAGIFLSLGDEAISPIEASSRILKSLKLNAQDDLGCQIKKAVITVPAYFDDAARAATKTAAEIAGLQVLRLLNEPTAAALAYGLDQQAKGIYVIFDLGGGTFDVSILKLSQGVFQVLATGGDTRLGGDDIDLLIAKDMPQTLPIQALLSHARLAKEALTEQNSFTITELSYTITRAKFNQLAAPIIEKAIKATRNVLLQADIDISDVAEIVLVGGSTRSQIIKSELTKLFGKAPLDTINPDTIVALGAALQAEALTKGSDNILLDVNPLSLGIETMGELNEKIIFRNTPIPFSKSQEFTTFIDGQTAMSIHVLQGEGETVSTCKSLAKFDLQGIPPLTAGTARINVTFTVDADGLLTVSAKEHTTGIAQRIEVKPSFGLDPQIMRELIEASQQSAQLEMEKRLLTEAKIEAQRLIMATNSALDQDSHILTAAEQAEIHQKIKLLEHLLAFDDRNDILSATKGLEETTRIFAQKRMDLLLIDGTRV